MYLFYRKGVISIVSGNIPPRMFAEMNTFKYFISLQRTPRTCSEKMIFTRKFFKICVALIALVTIFNVFYVFSGKSVVENFTSSALKSAENKKISWEDWDWINYEKTRNGPGEHGIEYIETDPELIKKNEEWVKKEGFYVEVSNKISLTRALPDNRPEV